MHPAGFQYSNGMIKGSDAARVLAVLCPVAARLLNLLT
jgi:hypothetical protein